MRKHNGYEILKAPYLFCCEQGGDDVSLHPDFLTLRSQVTISLGRGEGLSVVECISELMGICLHVWEVRLFSMVE